VHITRQNGIECLKIDAFDKELNVNSTTTKRGSTRI